MHKLPETGYLRLPQIIGNPKKGIPAIIPVGKSSWWNGVRTGLYPRPFKLGPRTTVWRVEEIRTLIASTSQEGLPEQPSVAGGGR